MMKQWLGRGIPKGRAYNLLRLWVGYDFKYLMADDGCINVSELNSIRKIMQYSTQALIIEDMQRSQSFYLFADADGKLQKFCSPLWHEPVEKDGSLMYGSFVRHADKAQPQNCHAFVTNCDSSVNENNNKLSKKENTKEKNVFSDQWSDGFAAHYPNLARMKKPLTENEYQRLLERGYANELIVSKLKRMENYPNIHKKYSSTYLTLLDWLK